MNTYSSLNATETLRAFGASPRNPRNAWSAEDEAGSPHFLVWRHEITPEGFVLIGAANPRDREHAVRVDRAQRGWAAYAIVMVRDWRHPESLRRGKVIRGRRKIRGEWVPTTLPNGEPGWLVEAVLE